MFRYATTCDKFSLFLGLFLGPREPEISRQDVAAGLFIVTARSQGLVRYKRRVKLLINKLESLRTSRRKSCGETPLREQKTAVYSC